ncbi:NADAR family protein [Nannocystaceae bacterium ST9]
MTIYFYRVEDAYGEFSNFAAYPIVIAGKTWPTSEHYFQAQKFVDTDPAWFGAIRKANTPGLAARMGRDRKRPLRRDWEAVKDDVMRRALQAKFDQHAELSELLLATGDEPLVEHTSNDVYWADGGDGSGKNMLGRLLVELRAKLRASG